MTSTSPSKTEPLAGAIRYSWSSSSAMPVIAMPDPSRKRRLTVAPINSRANSALGTISKANITATSPEVR